MVFVPFPCLGALPIHEEAVGDVDGEDDAYEHDEVGHGKEAGAEAENKGEGTDGFQEGDEDKDGGWELHALGEGVHGG